MNLRSKGFTLIELLVVIAIIAILGSFMFPMLSRSKDSARCAQDLSQLRQVVHGILMYADNHDGESVPCKTGKEDKPESVKVKAEWYGWPCHVLPYVQSYDVFCSPADKSIRSAVKKMEENIQKAVSAGQDVVEQGVYPGLVTSWGYNYRYFSDNNNEYIPIKMIRVQAPSRTLILANSIQFDDTQGEAPKEDYGYFRIMPPSMNTYWKPLTRGRRAFGRTYGHLWPRHSGGTICNAAFADGHVKSMKIDEFRDEELWRLDKTK
jgi:prepilin-type N-terminal cleavage/methylation domain-containing protein/prepilin-type processing-associated H-X9-DG protein